MISAFQACVTVRIGTGSEGMVSRIFVKHKSNPIACYCNITYLI
jgi:hypothetical protein